MKTMEMKIQASLTNPPIGAVITAKCIGQKISSCVEWTEDSNSCLVVNEEVSFTTNASISRYLARLAPELGLYGDTALERTEVDHWITVSMGPLASAQRFDEALANLDAALQRSTYLVGGSVTLADITVFGSLYGNGRWSALFHANKAPTGVVRWYSLLSNRDDFRAAIDALPDAAIKQARSGSINAVADHAVPVSTSAAAAKKDEGKFVELPDAEMGKVIVRFPPEASGYLHIGHAKAALLNQYYQLAFKGKLILRFDDTNPAKETAEFEQVILEDVKLLEIKPDIFSHTSDHFQLLITHCESMLNSGKAYCDDTEPEQMKNEREKKLDSKNRNNSVEMNLRMWSEMLAASEYGQRCCVRAKIDMQSPNGCMRDPTIYRCKAEPHLRTGTRHRVYPTYDFACPIVDSVEGVTHALRTTEYNDRDDQYYWFIEQLGLRRPHVWEYSRLNMTHTVLSKRKLAWFVAEGLVDSWEDPRFPTVRGVLRRGMTVEGLKQFILAQGSSRSVVTMEWDKIWAFNRKVIDPIAPRYTALEAGGGDANRQHPVRVSVRGAVERAVQVAKHPKNETVGVKTIWVSSSVLVDEQDARTLVEGQNATFINWGNLLIEKIEKDSFGKVVSIVAKTNLDDKDYKKTPKLTWLAESVADAPSIPVRCVYFENIISKAVLDRDDDFKNYVGHATRTEVEMIGEPELRNVKKGEIIQLQRRGFFICDFPYQPTSPYTSCSSPIVLFYVPDGHSKTVALGAPKKEETSGQHKTMSPAIADQTAFAQSTNSDVATVVDELNSQIIAQGDKVRLLKGQKASKDAVAAEVKKLLELKARYKSASGGIDWQPQPQPQSQPQAPVTSKSPGSDAKASRAEKKAETAKPNVQSSSMEAASKSKFTPIDDASAVALKARVEAQGEKVRRLKAGGGGSPNDVTGEVQTLLALKAEYKELTGEDATPRPAAAGSSKKAGVGESAKHNPQGKKSTGPNKAPATPAHPTDASQTTTGAGPKKQTRLGLEATKEQNLSDWYSQVITKAELIEYYDVSGCYILRPWAFAIWEAITAFFDAEIKKLGVQNCYFPMFVSRSALQKEKTHIADFAPEVAWVTKSGETDLAEPIAIRPTSETVMYPSFAKWIKSHRDLPLRINQWCSVVRWEFKHPQPFLRTREFLWQEGHSAFATRAEAEDEVYAILELYRRVYEELLAIPVIEGKKTEKEKFAGGDFTTTVEAYVSASGRGLQGGTSHHLGQNFSKMFEIVFEDADTNEKTYAHQNSWGLSTRSIGAMVMIHADNNGLVLPPRVASIQAVLVPCGITVQTTAEERHALVEKCRWHERTLKAAGVRCHLDHRDNYSPGWKFNHWELKGVPIRIELGPRDMKERQLVAVRRDTGEKLSIQEKTAVVDIKNLLERIHENMFNRAKKDLDDHLTVSCDWNDFIAKLDRKCIIQSPFCGDVRCEENIKKDSAKEEPGDAEAAGASLMGAKSLCIPMKQPTEVKPSSDKCIHPECKRRPIAYTLFGRSY